MLLEIVHLGGGVADLLRNRPLTMLVARVTGDARLALSTLRLVDRPLLRATRYGRTCAWQPATTRAQEPGALNLSDRTERHLRLVGRSAPSAPASGFGPASS